MISVVSPRPMSVNAYPGAVTLAWHQVLFFCAPASGLRRGCQETLATGDSLGILYNRDVKKFAFRLGSRMLILTASVSLHITMACRDAKGMGKTLACLNSGRSAAAFGNWRAR